MKTYTLEDGIRDATERAVRCKDRVSVYSDGSTVWVKLSVAAVPVLPGEAKWIGEATPDGQFTRKDGN